VGFFELSWGVRQGCQLSPYIFMLFAEVWGTTIRKDNEVKGITVDSTECELSEYADGAQKLLAWSFAVLEQFVEVLGLQVNCKRMECGMEESTNKWFRQFRNCIVARVEMVQWRQNDQV